jgi:cupin 2 domain-containing protein
VQNLFANTPQSSSLAEQTSVDEIVEVLHAAGPVRIERIISLGHASPPGFWYDQATDEWVLLVAGAARLRFEGDAESQEMKPGDYCHIPAHKRHRVDWTDPQTPTIWLAIHFEQ